MVEAGPDTIPTAKPTLSVNRFGGSTCTPVLVVAAFVVAVEAV